MSEKTTSTSFSYVQYLATFSGTFSIISNGMNQAWTSPYLPKLQADDSPIEVSSEEGSLCAVMAVVGAPVGAFLSSFMLNRIGRKYTILAISPVIIIAYLCIAFATSITTIIISRFTIAAVEGGLYTCLPIYIAEISEPSVRGFLTSTIDFASILGGLIINVIGPYFTIFESSMVACVVHLIHYLTFLTVPESPYYLLKKGKVEEAGHVLMRLRNTPNIDKELLELKTAVERQESNQRGKPWDLFLVKSNRNAVFIFAVLAFAKQFSGHAPFLFYTTTIFEKANTNINSTLSAIIYSSMRLLSQLPALLMVDRFGRRTLILCSALGCTFFLFLEGLYFYLLDIESPMVEYLNFLPITALIGYIIVFSCGVSFAPVLLLGELFPTNIKAFALGFGDSFSASLAALSAKYFQVTMEISGMFLPFWSFALVCLICAIFVYKIVPETKGKTLEQIQIYLINKK